MSRIKIAVITFLIISVTGPVFADTQRMFFAEYQFIAPEIKEGSFEATSRKLWRIGFRYMRLEEAPDPDLNIHGLIISNAPDTYLINLYTNIGQHLVDRAENTDVHVSVFQIPDLPLKIQELEMGYENVFIAKHNIFSTGVKTIQGIECDTHEIIISGFKVTLWKRRDNRNPLQARIEKDGIVYTVRYLQYENNLIPDFGLFEVPQGVRIME